MSLKKIDGSKILFDALKELQINLPELVAKTSLWASPEAVKKLKRKLGSSTRYPNVRRKRGEEIKGDVVNGIRFDDNTYANIAIKEMLGYKGDSKKHIKNMFTCHIYDETCYDEDYHTKIENLVLIPKAIAQLSDYHDEVKLVLKYRAYELYGWYYPKDKEPPTKPSNYPKYWNNNNHFNITITDKSFSKIEREFKELSDKEEYISKVEKEIDKVKKRVQNWFGKGRTQINSTILLIFLKLLGDNKYVSLSQLEKECNKEINSFNSNFAQMTCFGKRNHGKLFEIDKDKVYLWEPVKDVILHLYKQNSLTTPKKNI